MINARKKIDILQHLKQSVDRDRKFIFSSVFYRSLIITLIIYIGFMIQNSPDLIEIFWPLNSGQVVVFSE